ncbi:MAG TPA: hypothetical protein VN748_11035 [Pseudonocardiaceae bacterium]|jgi:hypothetical protein|nr:hypothetical protein [Pseudonocardiaceae bacterium]
MTAPLRLPATVSAAAVMAERQLTPVFGARELGKGICPRIIFEFTEGCAMSKSQRRKSMYLIDVRWIVLTVAVIGSGVAAAFTPVLVSPILVSAAVGTLFWVILHLGEHPTNED